ncbi:creatininase family protein [Sphingomonas sanxanigenens]|nr:creatininase family protein [Sphingomonas sanxanigenens]
MLHHWRDLGWQDFRDIDSARAVAVMPVAAIEQHGPHLPVSVDSDLNAGIVAAAAPLVAADVPVYLLPQLPVGKSNEHGAYPGTLSIGAATLIALWTDVADSVVRAGFRKLLIFNSHGGQPQLVDVVVRDLRVRHAILAVAASSYALGLPEGLFDRDEERHGIHAGDIETSMMMHLRPEVVKAEKMENFPSAGATIERDHQVLRLEGGVGMGWMTQDVNPSGAVGDPRPATAAKGAAAVAFAAHRLATLLAEISAYPLDAIRTAP